LRETFVLLMFAALVVLRHHLSQLLGYDAGVAAVAMDEHDTRLLLYSETRIAK
jgi:hypothetical protein